MSTNLVVEVRSNDIEGALKRFKALTFKSGLLREIKPRHYVKPSMARRLKSKVARAKIAKAARRKAASEAAWLQSRGQTDE